MPETARELVRPLSPEEKAKLREKEAWGHGKLPGLWPDVEQNQPDITQITRDIARGSYRRRSAGRGGHPPLPANCASSARISFCCSSTKFSKNFNWLSSV